MIGKTDAELIAETREILENTGNWDFQAVVKLCAVAASLASRLERANIKLNHPFSNNREPINGYRLKQTCFACPEQYDVFSEETDELVGFMHLRYGYFYAEALKPERTSVYSANPKMSDGTFHPEERQRYLTEAVGALDRYLRGLKNEG